MNITKARRDIGTSLISNSGMQTIYSVAIDHVTMNLQKGSYIYTSLYTHIFNFKDMYCQIQCSTSALNVPYSVKL